MISRNTHRAALLLAGIIIAMTFPAAQGLAADHAAQAPDAPTAQELAKAKDTVQRVLNHWDYETWDQVLASDVQVQLRLGTITTDSQGSPAAIGTELEATGRDEGKKLLKSVYGDLKKNAKITGQVAYGYEVILIGELSVTDKDKPQSLPIACYVQFNPKGKIERLTLMSIDTRPLLEAAARTASDKQ